MPPSSTMRSTAASATQRSAAAAASSASAPSSASGRTSMSSSSSASGPSASPSVSATLAAAFTRLGFDDGWAGAGVGAAAGIVAATASAGPPPGSVNQPRPELLRELEWIDGACVSCLSREALAHLRTTFHSLSWSNALTPQEIQSFNRLRLSERVVEDRAEIAARMKALQGGGEGGSGACKANDGPENQHHDLDEALDDIDDDEADELERLEREIASLTIRSSRLDESLQRGELSRRQLDSRRLQIAQQKTTLESMWDGEQERDAAAAAAAAAVAASARDFPPLPSNRIHSSSEISVAVSAVNDQTNEALEQVAQAVREVETLVTKGKYPSAANADAARTRSDADQQQPLSLHATQSELPSMSAEGLSAFDSDSAVYNKNPPRARDSSTNGSSASPAPQPSSAASSSSVDSPFLLHHPSLLASYLAKDDAWARGLNALFRAQFGSPPSATKKDESVTVGRLQQTVALLSQGEGEGNEGGPASSASSEMDAVIAATPHVKHLPRTPATLRARAARAQQVSRTNLKSVSEHEHEAEEAEQKQQTNGSGSGGGMQRQISFTTPPHHSSRHSSTSSLIAAPVSTSSLSPSSYERYTAELRRLYEVFPDSQAYWLCANLDYLGQKARVAAQHASMVSEETTRAMGRRATNEAIAEAAVQVAAATESLSVMLTTPPDSSHDPSSKVQSFPALWSSLRSLQLLEVLRTDLEFKFRRQSEYLVAQKGIISLLLAQRARHELLLAAQRWGLERLETLRGTMHAAWGDLDAEAKALQGRREAYRHHSAMHQTTQSMVAPSRLGIDSRAKMIARAARMAELGARSVKGMNAPSAPPMPPAAAASVTAASSSASSSSVASASSAAAASAAAVSFDSLLSSSQFLSLYPERLAVRSKAAEGLRARHFKEVCRAAREVRKVAFDDLRDVHVGGKDERTQQQQQQSIVASSTSSNSNSNVARLAQSSFARHLQRTDQAVDRAGAGLNAILQQHASLMRKLQSGSGSGAGAAASSSTTSASSDVASLVDRTVRPVWTEFIVAPDLLEQRIRRLQQQLKEVETR